MSVDSYHVYHRRQKFLDNRDAFLLDVDPVRLRGERRAAFVGCDDPLGLVVHEICGSRLARPHPLDMTEDVQ